MELIAQEPGMRSLDEPLSPWSGALAQVRNVAKYPAGQIIHFENAHEEQQLRRYFELLFSGAMAVNAPWKFWKPHFNFRTDRSVAKIPEAKCLIDWFDANFDVQVVLLCRHPITRARSCIRNGWGTNLWAFLNNRWFCADVLGDELTDYSLKIMSDGSPLEQHVLSWALENLIALRVIDQRPNWVFVSYESCVLQPELTLDMLATRLDLKNVDGMRARLNVPSRSSNMSEQATRAQILSGESAAKLGRWRTEVSEAEERALLSILERFQIPLYRAGSDEAHPWW